MKNMPSAREVTHAISSGVSGRLSMFSKSSLGSSQRAMISASSRRAAISASVMLASISPAISLRISSPIHHSITDAQVGGSRYRKTWADGAGRGCMGIGQPCRGEIPQARPGLMQGGCPSNTTRHTASSGCPLMVFQPWRPPDLIAVPSLEPLLSSRSKVVANRPCCRAYVLVDEFQDISRGRMALLQALARFDVAWFLVGDDWQSIYRFAGSDVGLVRTCQAYLGYTTERTLSQTFRFGRGILDPSTAFVRRNPEQTRRPLRSSSSGDDTGISVIFESDTTL